MFAILVVECHLMFFVQWSNLFGDLKFISSTRFVSEVCRSSKQNYILKDFMTLSNTPEGFSVMCFCIGFHDIWVLITLLGALGSHLLLCSVLLVFTRVFIWRLLCQVGYFLHYWCWKVLEIIMGSFCLAWIPSSHSLITII